MTVNYYDTLAKAKAVADSHAKRDDAEWVVYDRGSNVYPYQIEPGHKSKPYDATKALYRANPNLLTIHLTPQEAEEYKRYLGTEQMTDNGLIGGYFQTPVQKSIFKKLLEAISA